MSSVPPAPPQGASLFEEHESSAFSDFLDKLAQDSDFLMNPGVPPGLPSWHSVAVGQEPPYPADTGKPAPDCHGKSSKPKYSRNKRSASSAETTNRNRRAKPARSKAGDRASSMGTQGSTVGDDSDISPPQSLENAGGRRETLTDQQKRENHILSEQRRRNIIKEGFSQLETIVPGLSRTGNSKAHILTRTVAYMEQLLDDIRALEQMNTDNRPQPYLSSAIK